jgi:hypothetical protein
VWACCNLEYRSFGLAWGFTRCIIAHPQGQWDTSSFLLRVSANEMYGSMTAARTVTSSDVFRISFQDVFHTFEWCQATSCYKTSQSSYGCLRTECLLVVVLFLFCVWRATQQMLRTHRSLEASCATLWWRWFFVSFFQVMEHRWNENDRKKPKYSGKKLSQCYFVHHKSHMDWPGIEPGPPRWEAGD